MTFLINQLTFYSRNQLKSAKPLCTDYKKRFTVTVKKILTELIYDFNIVAFLSPCVNYLIV